LDFKKAEESLLFRSRQDLTSKYKTITIISKTIKQHYPDVVTIVVETAFTE